MKKIWVIAIGVILALVALAPFASKDPDAIQRLLNLPGGGGSMLKAASGVAVSAALVLVVAYGLKRIR